MADVIGVAGPDGFGLVEFFELIVLFLDLLLLLLILILVLVLLITINLLQFGLVFVFVFLSFLQVEYTTPYDHMLMRLDGSIRCIL